MLQFLKCSTCTYSCHNYCLDLDDPASELTWPARTSFSWQCPSCCADPSLEIGSVVVADKVKHAKFHAHRTAMYNKTLLKISKSRAKWLTRSTRRVTNKDKLMELKAFLLGHGYLINERLWTCVLNREQGASSVFIDPVKKMRLLAILRS